LYRGSGVDRGGAAGTEHLGENVMTKPVGKEPLALVQAWVPRSLHAWAQREAKKKGLSVAAWLRMRLIEMQEEAERP
jgi:hypothetical protein